jgi:hypothetical protein
MALMSMTAREAITIAVINPFIAHQRHAFFAKQALTTIQLVHRFFRLLALASSRARRFFLRWFAKRTVSNPLSPGCRCFVSLLVLIEDVPCLENDWSPNQYEDRTERKSSYRKACKEQQELHSTSASREGLRPGVPGSERPRPLAG